MAEEDYFGSVYNGGPETGISNVPFGAQVRHVGRLTADDNGGANVVDLSNVYRNLYQGSNDEARRRAMLDKQLRTAYMSYDTAKVPAQFRQGYADRFKDYQNFYLQNAKALKKGDVGAAMELERKQNELRDYAAMSQQRGAELKNLHTKVATLADKKRAGWTEDFFKKINGINDPYQELDDVYSLFQGNGKLDTYKAENGLLTKVAKPVRIKIGKVGGVDKYSWAPQTEQNKALVSNFTNTPEGAAIIEQLVDSGAYPNYLSAKSAYIDKKTDELDRRSLGGVDTMGKLDTQANRESRAQGMYDMAQGLYPLKKALMLSQIKRNGQSFDFGNTPQIAQQFYTDIYNDIITNPDAAVEKINTLTPAKNSINGSLPLAYDPATRTIKGTLLNGSNKPIIVDWPANQEGAAMAVQAIQNSFVNSSQAATQQRLKSQTKPKAQSQPKSTNKPKLTKGILDGL